MPRFCLPTRAQCLPLILLTLFSLGAQGEDSSAIKNTNATAHNNTITVCSEPITLGSGFNSIIGLSGRTIKSAITHAAETMGYQAKFVEQPWRRCIQMAQNNIVDALMASVWTQERSQFMQYPLDTDQPDPKRRVWVSYYSIFTAQDTPLTWDGKTFSGIKHGIGAPPGYVVTEQLQALGVLNKQVDSAQEGFKLVAHGRLDGFAVERSVGYSHIDAMQLQDKVVEMPRIFSHQNLYVPLSNTFYQKDPSRGERFFDLVADYYRQTRQ